MTATSVVEVMASSNAIKKREAKRRGVRNPVYEVNSETHASHESIQSLLDNENHQVRNEIAQVSSLSLFYPRRNGKLLLGITGTLFYYGTRRGKRDNNDLSSLITYSSQM